MVIRNTHDGSVSLTRAEAEAWLTWKGAKADRMVKVGVWAAVIAAFVSIIGVVVGVLAWLEPLGH